MTMPPATQPRVSIILVNLNQEHHTRECILSLQQLTYPNVEVVLIDNGSKDGSGERIHKDFPAVTYAHLERNLGFAGGNNAGIRMALDGGADYILLLNNDTIADPGCIEPLIAYDREHPDTGAQCGKIYFFDEPKKIWFAGGGLDPEKGLGVHVGIHQVDDGSYDAIREMDYATGCMLFVRRSVMEQTGVLDESMFAYFEDADWCLRARKLGLKIIYNPTSVIWHKASVTSKIDSPVYLYLTMRNKIFLVRKHGANGKWIVHLPYFTYFYARHFFRMLLKHHTITGAHAVIAGLIDGLRKYAGEYGRGRLHLFAPPEMI
jgi:GT2 family glycosyltransferase